MREVADASGARRQRRTRRRGRLAGGTGPAASWAAGEPEPNGTALDFRAPRCRVDDRKTDLDQGQLTRGRGALRRASGGACTTTPRGKERQRGKSDVLGSVRCPLFYRKTATGLFPPGGRFDGCSGRHGRRAVRTLRGQRSASRRFVVPGRDSRRCRRFVDLL